MFWKEESLCQNWRMRRQSKSQEMPLDIADEKGRTRKSSLESFTSDYTALSRSKLVLNL